MNSGDIHDTVKDSHETGGGRRSFVSMAFNHMGRGLPDGRAALISWAQDQGNRPVAWWPWVFSYDAYYGVLGPDRKAPLWKYDQRPRTDGRSSTAHLESSALLRARRPASTNASRTSRCCSRGCLVVPWRDAERCVALGWTGSQQPRACGWMLLLMARACLLG
jgi:hypothetical protein